MAKTREEAVGEFDAMRVREKAIGVAADRAIQLRWNAERESGGENYAVVLAVLSVSFELAAIRMLMEDSNARPR